MRKLSMLLLALLVPILIGANAITGMSTERPRFAAHILKIQLSQEAISRTDLPTEYRSEAPAFGIVELDELAASYGAHKIIRAHIRMKDREFEQRTGFDRWFLIVYDQPLNVLEALKAFKAYPAWIQEATPEFIAYTTVVPNDTYYANNWGHNNTAQLPVYTGGSHSGAGVGTIGFDSDAQLAWDQSQGYGSASIIIAIIDTGVDTAHPDLRLVTGYDYGDNDSNPMDNSADPGHGTACSGVAAGRANNALGVTGMAGGCSVMPLKIADSAGNLYFTAIDNALTHCGNNGVHVASMSFGAEGGMVEGNSPSTDTALEYAYSQGVTLLAATANSNASTIAYPSNHNKVISVGASSPTGQRKSPTSSDGENWWGSNYGVATQNNQNAVDIMAPTILPCTDITGTGNGYNTSSDYYMWFNGTSCATPYAAGVAALIKSKDPSLTPAQVRTALTSTATDMTFDGGAGWDRFTGYGLVNANAALLSLVPGMPACQITAPADGSLLNLNSIVTVNVTATDTDGTITSVAFYIDNVLQYTDYASPWTWDWNTTGFAAGSHTIKAIATDNSANTATSTVSVSLIAPPDEGFETGNFSAYSWINTSGVPWTVQSAEKYSGNYAAKSGAIGHSSSTDLSVSVNVTAPGNISFFHKVSSESSYDYLYFYIDNIQQGLWSGAGSWTQQSYAVAAGAHTFRWRYSKDNSVSSGSDCVWIDHIKFPPHAIYYAPPQNLSSVAGNGYVNLGWQAPLSGSPTGYKIFRNSALLTTVGGLSYTDNAVVNESTYSYYVTAVYASGESEASNTVNATPSAIVTPEVVLGTGTSYTGTQEGCPINIWYKSLHGQSIYTAAELSAAGVVGPILITHLGFNVLSAPTLALPNFKIRMNHTADTNVYYLQPAAGMTTVYTNPAYMPTAGGYDMIALTTPFEWNGIDNIVIDTGFGLVASYSATGQVQYTSITSGYRYIRDDNNDVSDVFGGVNVTSSRPNVKLRLLPSSSGPLIAANPTSFSYGDVAAGTVSIQQFTIQNSGDETLSGTITTPTGYNVSLLGRDNGFARYRSESRNSLAFSVNTGQTNTYVLEFAPTAAGTYNGNVVISSNASNNPTLNLAVTGSSFVPATISLSTNQLTATINPDAAQLQVFTIGNTGSQILDYQLMLMELRAGGSSLRAASERSIIGSTLVVDPLEYSVGATQDWTFSVYNASTDYEYLSDVHIDFPAGVMVNSATSFVGGSSGNMIPDITSGDGITIHWHGVDGNNWGVVLPGQTAVATVNVTVSSSFGGIMSLPYQINGDIYGAEPHVLNGVITLTPNWTPLSWFDVTPVIGSVTAGGSVMIEAYFHSDGLAPGQYQANLRVNSNDPIHPQMTIAVTLNVLNPNQAPVIIPPDVLGFTRNGSLIEDFSPFVSDPDGDPLTLQASGNVNIQVQIDGLVATLSAPDGWVGSEDITFTVSDGALQASAIVNVSCINTPPWVDLPEGWSFARNGSLQVNLEPFGGDDDGDGLEVTWSATEHIQVELDGLIATFSAPYRSVFNGWAGSESITFTVDDGITQTSDTVLITVTNSAPTLDLPFGWFFSENTEASRDLSEFAADAEGDLLEYSFAGNTHIALDFQGSLLTATPEPGWHGFETVTITVSDGYLQASDTWEIVVEHIVSSLDTPVVTISTVGPIVVLDWQDVPDAMYYRVFASSDPYDGYVQIGSADQSHFELPLTAAKAFYKVTAVHNPPTK